MLQNSINGFLVLVFFNWFILQFINFLKNLLFCEIDKTKLTHVVCMKTFAIFHPILVQSHKIYRVKIRCDELKIRCTYRKRVRNINKLMRNLIFHRCN
jgi:hypothetical protein